MRLSFNYSMFNVALFMMLFSIGSVLTVRHAFAAGIDGNWLFTLDTEGGVREVPATLKLEGNKVAGKWGEFDIKGTFSEGTLDLDFPIYVESIGIEGSLIIKGKLKDGKLAGSWAFDQYAGTFEASHPD